MAETELDSALEVAKANPAQANFFYDTFLNTAVYIPALAADKKPGEWMQLQPTDRFFPLYLKHEESRAIPVFDRLDRLKTWAGDRAFNYLVLQAHTLIKVIAPEIAIVINEGTPHRYLFLPEILESLRAAAKPVAPN
ncbi:SseB family protein [bacterium]|nr:SseB family protein [bacterium]